MKRLLQVFFLLLFLSTLGATAYINWITIGADRVAVVVDGVDGVRSTPLLPGRHWIWGASIPGQIQIHQIETRRRSINVIMRRSVIDALYMDLGEEFYLQVPLRLAIEIEPGKAVDLFEALDQRFKRLRKYLKTQLGPHIAIKYKELTANEFELNLAKDRLELYIQTELLAKIKEPLAEVGIIIHKIDLNLESEFQVPILSALEKEKYRRYDEFLSRKKDEVLKKITRLAKLEAKEKKHKLFVKTLKEIGPILEEYPNLKNYLAIEKLGPQVKVMLANPDKYLTGNLSAAEFNAEEATDEATDEAQPAFQYKPGE